MKYKQGFENIDYSRFQCPKKLLYQFGDDFKLKISNKCCYKLKKALEQATIRDLEQLKSSIQEEINKKKGNSIIWWK